MKILLIILLLVTQTNYSQWINQNPVPNGNDLWSVFFTDDNNGWIVGSDGFINKTSNAGIDWVEQNSKTNLILKSVQFVDQNTGWICGESGLIMKTTDGGQNWFNLISGTTKHLTKIHFLDFNTGFTVGFGGTILKTTDGGLSWVNQPSGTSSDIYDIDFVNSLEGYAVGGEFGSYAILKTTDGGLSWTNKGNNFYYDYLSMLSVKFIDANTGFIGGGYSNQNVILKTTDGGENWIELVVMSNRENTKQHFTTEQTIRYNSGGVNSIYFKDKNIGYAVGGNVYGWDRKIYTTTDGGSTWIRKYSGWEENGLIAVSGNNQGQGWAVGFTGAIFMTENDGDSWEQILSGDKSSFFSGDDIYSLFYLNEDVIWAVGKRNRFLPSAGDVILKTTNGGKVWKTQQFFQSSEGPTKSVYFIDENFGWAVGDGTFGFYRTTDGGENWTSAFLNGSSVFFIDQNTGWVTSDKDNAGIYKSTNGGITWNKKSSISSSCIFFINDNLGLAVGAGGSILKSVDGGENWLAKTSGTLNNLNSIKFYDSNLGICVGEAGTVLLTTDGGENWTSQNAGAAATLTDVYFTNSATVWIAGFNGTILNTTDLGSNWISYNGLTENNLTSLCFADEYTGWFGGMNGTMFKYQEKVVPVELVSFTANVVNDIVELNWKTATEVNNYGFNIERKTENQEWDNIGFVEGHGSSTSQNFYSFTDEDMSGANKFQYRLKQLDTDGSYKYSNEVEVEIIPATSVLYQNYPNPFNPSTVIEFSLSEASEVSLAIYNALGQKITELVNTSLMAGRYSYQWNAPQSGIATGIYICELRTEKFVSVKKMLLMK